MPRAESSAFFFDAFPKTSLSQHKVWEGGMESEFDEADRKYIAHTGKIYLTKLLKQSW